MWMGAAGWTANTSWPGLASCTGPPVWNMVCMGAATSCNIIIIIITHYHYHPPPHLLAGGGVQHGLAVLVH